MGKYKSTETVERCTIQERSVQIDGQGCRRWIVTWKANSESKPIGIVCKSKVATYNLAGALNDPGVLWPTIE